MDFSFWALTTFLLVKRNLINRLPSLVFLLVFGFNNANIMINKESKEVKCSGAHL